MAKASPLQPKPKKSEYEKGKKKAKKGVKQEETAEDAGGVPKAKKRAAAKGLFDFLCAVCIRAGGTSQHGCGRQVKIKQCKGK